MILVDRTMEDDAPMSPSAVSAPYQMMVGDLGPLGATITRKDNGDYVVNWALFAPDASEVLLYIYRDSRMFKREATPTLTFPMTKKGDIHCLKLRNVELPLAYSFALQHHTGREIVVRDPYGHLTASAGVTGYGNGSLPR